MQLDLLSTVEGLGGPSPISIIGRSFDSLVGLAGKPGKPNSVEFNGKGFDLETSADGALIIRAVEKQPKKKAA